MLTAATGWERNKRYIPNGCQTLSKSPERYVDGVYPKLLVSGNGCQVYDENGQYYYDYISSLGANLLGYNNPAVDDAVKETINMGQVLLSFGHPKEGELAQKLHEILGFKSFKFFKTGSEAVSAAVRVARAYTKRDVVLLCGYHGWHDWAAITYDRPSGIPKGLGAWSKKVNYNDLDTIAKLLKNGDVAAIVLEPVVYDEPKNNFLEELIRIAHANGAIVIFDEIVTGLRFGEKGASGLLNVRPDLLCMGKALGNGYPIAVLAGDENMRVFEMDDFLVSGTFGGDLIGISAAIATLEQIKPEKIWRSGSLLKSGFNAIASDLGIQEIRCLGYAPRTMFDFPSPAHKALFWQECVKREVLFGYANFVTQVHGNIVINKTLNCIGEAIKKVKDNWKNPQEKLEGKMPVQVLR